ncbi:MAG: TM0996/MTH895 family glutaredoxin-like protein [Ruminococcus sp.]|nr:TM0996/MTH895 family glutaredoxin-like protein [Ruminococcus sp.]
MNIKILGGGCASCKKLYENTKKAVAETEIKADVEYITDMQKIMEYGVMKMPALVVNEQVVAMGKVLKPAEIVKLLEKVGD